MSPPDRGRMSRVTKVVTKYRPFGLVGALWMGSARGLQGAATPLKGPRLLRSPTMRRGRFAYKPQTAPDFAPFWPRAMFDRLLPFLPAKTSLESHVLVQHVGSLSIAVGHTGNARCQTRTQAESHQRWHRWECHTACRQEESLKSLPVLQSSESSLQRD